ncbi:hypothetical protein MMC19_005573 [Ptychographa xylographoides]|nr:hypothetical protein [Ptychographa xylographoides]
MTGLEVPALLLGKFIIGKAITWGGAHVLAGASSGALTSLSMHAGANAIAGATGAGSTIGAATAAGSSVLAYKGFATAIAERKEKNARKSGVVSLKAGALGQILGPLQGELIAAVHNSLEKLYRELELKNPSNTPKKRLDEIQICVKEGCDCLDYNFDEDKSRCACGHHSSNHKTPTEDQIDISLLLLYLLAKETYPKLYRSHRKERSTDIDEMEPCSKCGCTDLRQNTALYCWCSHSADSHNSNVEYDLFKKREALVEILAEHLYRSLSHYDSNNNYKNSLYEIRPGFGSGCWDFNYSWTVPFSDTSMCKCGSRNSSHTGYRAS